MEGRERDGRGKGGERDGRKGEGRGEGWEGEGRGGRRKGRRGEERKGTLFKHCDVVLVLMRSLVNGMGMPLLSDECESETSET